VWLCLGYNTEVTEEHTALQGCLRASGNAAGLPQHTLKLLCSLVQLRKSQEAGGGQKC
jgi:hypothetical protein